ncbi:PDZ domain-containing protein [Blastopirellula sp. JC732]|uniref:PDZ domain-containing protein n=1 Tax=Blastopirellula sediminis TaxID=2894196 RepID=A0A9X1MP69_9BACT|nr:PDZ domain-containing protein [Blastopirellula sediminis]MCC9606884.1 PDZ domain-containing protein [Blastopirellula sediminis]MCC9629820.1 PDZ domain-containing protein [Blastopirellula sediminis]
MKFGFCITLSLVSILIGANLLLAADEQPKRYLAAMENGERLADEQIRNWYSNNALPQLAGRNLIDGDNSMRWLLDRSLQPSETPNAYIELVSGDRLPGDVTRYVPTSSVQGAIVPSHFEVQPTVDIRRPGDQRIDYSVRVLDRFVKKIVWKRGGPIDRYEPSSAYYRDGRKVSFRAIRLVDGDAHLLLANGRRVARFDELAELHMPQADSWNVYLDELGTLLPNGFSDPKMSRILQWESIDGIVATTSLERFDADSQGDNNQGDRWVHAMQPAWSLDVLWIPNARSYLRRSFAPERPPLVRFAQTEDRSGAFFSENGWPVRNNRSVVGGPLRTGDELYGWGLGVLAASKISVPLSPLVRGFQTKIGLDYAARDGGCVQARIYLDNERLFESPLIVGSKEVIDSGALSWPAEKKVKELRLEVDPAHDNRPAGADPFDIRDLTNWLEPQFLLDRGQLETEVRARAIKQIAAWEGWAVAPQPEGEIRIVNLRRDVDRQPIEWRLAALAVNKPFELRRTLDLSADDRWLTITTDRWGNFGAPPRLEVLLDGATALESELPESQRHELGQTPRYVSLAGRTGPVEVVIRQFPCDARMPIDWREISVGPERMTLITVLEDPTAEQVAEMKTESGAEGKVELVDSPSMIGAPAIRIAPSDEFVEVAKFDPPLVITERSALGELRFLRFAYRKEGGGRLEIRFSHSGDRETPAIYRIGKGSAKEPGYVVLDAGDLKEEWRMGFADLFANFGEIGVTGMSIRVVDGGHCIFDHFYLARRHTDYELIIAPSPDRNNWENWNDRREQNLPQALAASVTIDYGDGRQGRGFIVHETEGWVVAPGHQVFPPQRDVKITTADGQTFAAKTAGVDREHDLGLLQITDMPPKDNRWPWIDLTYRENYERQQVLLAVGVDANQKPAAEVIRKEGEFFGAIWTSPPDFPFDVGQGAIEIEQRLGGLCVEVLSGGSPVIVNPYPVRKHWDRLKRNEVFGDWLIGAGPQMGMNVRQADGGVEVTEVRPGGPAAEIGFRVGDLLTKVHGREVRSRGDVMSAVSGLNPGDEVDIEYRRIADRSSKRLKLGRRD